MAGQPDDRIPKQPVPDAVLRWLGRLLGILLGIALFGLAAPLRVALALATPPAYTASWYVDVSDPTTLPTKLHNMGCKLGTHDYNAPGRPAAWAGIASLHIPRTMQEEPKAAKSDFRQD